MDSLHRSKRQKLDHIEHGVVQKSRCDPCEQDFTTHRAYLRHVRENRRHRSEGTDGERDYGCPFCSKTFARAHDRNRHLKDQHADGKVLCFGCGKRLRYDAPYNNAAGSACDWNSAERPDVGSNPLKRLDLSRTQGFPTTPPIRSNCVTEIAFSL